jgi:hypothetical protein
MPKWLTEEDAVAHVAGCTWYGKKGSVRIRIPAREYARALLRNELEDGVIHARGPLEFPPGIPKVPNPYWATVNIPPEFWKGAEPYRESGVQNRSRSERVPWFEVNKGEVCKRWPASKRIPMPAPFDIDWPQLPHVVEAMKQRLDLSEAGACRRLFDQLTRGALRARKLSDTPAVEAIDTKELAKLDRLPDHSIAGLYAGLGVTPTKDRRQVVELWGDEVVALWSDLVLKASGRIAASIVILPQAEQRPHPDSPPGDQEPGRSNRYAGRPSVKVRITSKMKERFAAGERCNTVTTEARWLYDWARATFPTESGLPGGPKVVENQIREDFNSQKAKVTNPSKKAH